MCAASSRSRLAKPSSTSVRASAASCSMPSRAAAIVAMENAGLEVVAIENLRRHYALTLDAWIDRFERNWEKIHAIDPQRFDERFRRVWLAYLYGCAEMFRSPHGRTHLFPIVFHTGNV